MVERPHPPRRKEMRAAMAVKVAEQVAAAALERLE